MSLKKIKQPEFLKGSIVAIYYDDEWEEYQVKIAGKPKATHHTDDKQEAIDTSRAMLAETLKKPAPRVKKNPVKSPLTSAQEKQLVEYNFTAKMRSDLLRKMREGFSFVNARDYVGYGFTDKPKKNPAPKSVFSVAAYGMGSTPKFWGNLKTEKEARAKAAYALDFGYHSAEIYKNDVLIDGFGKNADKPKKNPIVPGITARPVKGKRRPVFAVEHAKAKTGPWTTAGLFPNRTLASDYAQAMHGGNPGKWWRVVLK